MRTLLSLVALAFGAVSVPGQAAPPVERVADTPPHLSPLPALTSGRTKPDGAGWTYQWPGTYAEAAFTGSEIFLRVGTGPAILHVLVDDKKLGTLVRPEAGWYRVDGLEPGRHVLRVESASENQDGVVTFGGFAVGANTKPAPLAPRKRQIEFIGDSHTVGYGNISTSRDCTEDRVWETTDTSSAFGALVGRHYDADYRVNAISGRGIVRNYDGSDGDPVPVAWPFVLFDKAQRDVSKTWHPSVLVISLGTNDFSTKLNAQEPWKDRDALHADYEATYAKFLKTLRARFPKALFVLWATDLADGEIQAEVHKVVDTATASGDRNIVFLPVNSLEMTGCHWHPSVADDQKIAAALITTIDARKIGW